MIPLEGNWQKEAQTSTKRISERLRHKGRAITRFDYERITLEQFPEIWKVKCINHTLGLANTTYQKDLELAPGFVLSSSHSRYRPIKSEQSFSPESTIEFAKRN